MSADLPRAKQTDRVLRAMDHRRFTLLARPTGHLLGEREACAIDLTKVLNTRSFQALRPFLARTMR